MTKNEYSVTVDRELAGGTVRTFTVFAPSIEIARQIAEHYSAAGCGCTISKR